MFGYVFVVIRIAMYLRVVLGRRGIFDVVFVVKLILTLQRDGLIIFLFVRVRRRY